MSLDATYILVYENHNYVDPFPWIKDIDYLKEKYGGSFIKIDMTTIYWSKPKYTLPRDELNNLLADQILERKDCELWEIIK